MHSGLVVTTSGVPIGLTAIKFWTRKKVKGTNALKKKIDAKPGAIVHIGDRESDVYELFAAAKDVGTHFLFRTCSDRLTVDHKCGVSEIIDQVRVKGIHRIEVRDKRGNVSQAVLELRYRN